MIQVKYSSLGIIFGLTYQKEKILFPLSLQNHEYYTDSDWFVLNELEQLWQQGFLYPHKDGYLLKPEDYYDLDEETIQNLPIVKEPAQIGIEEVGNIGADNYAINWYLIIHGRPSGSCRRYGNIAVSQGFKFILDRHQYRLIQEIEKKNSLSDIEARARYQAKCKYLAERASARIPQFTKDREFYFSNSSSIDIKAQDDQNIELFPVLEGIPEDLQGKLPKTVKLTNQYRVNGKRMNVFVDGVTRDNYNTICSIPPIRGIEVPHFLDNPLMYIPEEIEYDPDLFSKRVRGLKIRKSAAVPYIHIEPREGESGWFDVQTGISVRDSYGEEEDYTLPDTEERESFFRKAIESGDDYIYYDDQWIKIDPDVLAQYQEALALQKTISASSKVSKEQLRQILDIYENIEGIEYDEGILELKQFLIVSEPIPDCFCGQLKDYQNVGYSFLKQHFLSKMGVLLADDMGLGKTVQIIALLAYLYENDNLSPALIVMPNSLIENWKAELLRFLPAARAIYVHQGSSRSRQSEYIKRCDIVLTTYETLSRDQALLGKIRWSCVICDEVQKIKNFKTLAANAVKGMNTNCRIALTGTPVENRLGELWSIVDFAQPGLLKSYYYFRKTYELPIQSGSVDKNELVEDLLEKLSPVFLRRTKDVVLKGQLPEKYEINKNVEISDLQRQLYTIILDEYKNSDENIALATIQKLIMVCSHPRLLLKSDIAQMSASQLEEESPKLYWTIQLLKDLQAKNEKVVIFTGYKRMQAILRQVIYEELGIDTKIINGEVKGNRLDIIKEFGDVDGFNVLILSPRAAGVGLNIVAANNVIHYTREWNPAIENQATDRVYRIGQKKDVSVFYPILMSPDFTTSEERLDTLLQEKRGLMKSVIVPSDLQIKAEDFQDILK